MKTYEQLLVEFQGLSKEELEQEKIKAEEEMAKMINDPDIIQKVFVINTLLSGEED